MALFNCLECSKEISSSAISCPYCGHPLRVVEKIIIQNTVKTNNGIAAVLSLIFPGAGQIYKGKIGIGLMWLFFVILGYMCFILPGVILHIICILMAATD